MTTGFVWNERYAWHDIHAGAGPLRARGWIEPGEPHAENAATKRRFRNLVDASGLLEHLVQIPARPAELEQLLRFHTARYVEMVRTLSDGEGGPLGGLDAYAGPGTYEIARLATGGVIAAMEAIIAGDVTNAYALVRPPGHHAEADAGNGFCTFNHVAVAAKHGLAAHGLERIAVVDWDVHHGNGTQSAFIDDPRVLTISIHQDGWFPPHSGTLAECGVGEGHGYNINVPLPPGSGTGAYHSVFDRIVLPAVRRFAPQFIIVASGLDANAMDPLSRQLLGPDDYRWMTAALMEVAAEQCDGRLLLSHEGGYHAGVVPFCGLAAVEQLAGKPTGIEDPFAEIIRDIPGQDLNRHQQEFIDRAAAAAPFLA